MLQIQNNQSNNSNHFRWSSEQPNLTGTYQEREGGREEKKREEKRRKEKKREEKKRKEKEIVFYLQKSFKKTFFSWKGRQRHSDTKRIEMACDKRTFDEVLADSYITIYSIVKWQPMSE